MFGDQKKYLHCKVQVCIVCARKCHKLHAVDPKLVSNIKEPKACCECCIDNNSTCNARFSVLRENFDKFAYNGSVNEGFILLSMKSERQKRNVA